MSSNGGKDRPETKNLPRSGLAAPGEVCFSFLERRRVRVAQAVETCQNRCFCIYDALFLFCICRFVQPFLVILAFEQNLFFICGNSCSARNTSILPVMSSRIGMASHNNCLHSCTLMTHLHHAVVSRQENFFIRVPLVCCMIFSRSHRKNWPRRFVLGLLVQLLRPEVSPSSGRF